MIQKYISHPITYVATVCLVAFGVVICVFPHFLPACSRGVNYAVQLMLLYLAAGLVTLFFKQPKLTFVFFGGCLLLCFFLKYSLKNDAIDRWRNQMLQDNESKEQEVRLKAAQFNLSNNAEPAEIMQAFRSTKADILSIHEVTPDWNQWLEDSLGKVYPYHHTMVDIGIFGMAVYSRYPLVSIDTFYYDEIPNLRACIDKDGTSMCFVSVHTLPALNNYSLKRLKEHLSTVAGQVARMDMPLIVLGDFNSVSWSKELQDFMDNTGLLESRSGFMDRQGSFWDVPLDHIFHSTRLSCADFNSLNDDSGRHLGIMGAFLLKPLVQHVKKTAQ
ncbi:MAG: endonuclease/exonuclease/phosphatase family protein [Bacteroidetes bacterium]|nr:endonuclease/exonuclease/phosphatase family protein [Bacteroidota bacterium]